jgi:hypothetical protein
VTAPATTTDSATTAATDAAAGSAKPAVPQADTQKTPSSLYDGVSDEMKAWGQSKGYKGEPTEFGKILASLQEHDRYRGRSVVIPGEDAKPEDLASFYAKLGRPEKPEGYKLADFKAADGADLSKDPTVNWFKGAAFEAGLGEKQANLVASKFAAFAAETAAREEATRIAKITADETAVREKWGANAAQNERAVLALAKATNLEQTDIAAIVSAWGVEKWANFAAGLGGRLLESDHGHEDSTAATRGTFGMAPEAALVEIEALRQGRGELAEKYKKNDPAAMRRVTELHRRRRIAVERPASAK